MVTNTQRPVNLILNDMRSTHVEPLTTRVSRLTLISVPWLITIFGVLPLTLATALTFYALATGWLTGLVFGLGWLSNFTVFVCLIYWVNRNERLTETKIVQYKRN